MARSEAEQKRFDRQRVAGRSVAKQNIEDALAFIDRHREIVELPPKHVDGDTMRRKRGTREDEDTVQEILLMYAQGATMTEVLKHVGLPYVTWHKWRDEDRHQLKVRYAFAHVCHLEAMADKTLLVFEELEAKREECMAIFKTKHDAWVTTMNEWEAEKHPDIARPIEPIYWGPSEWELNSAREKAKIWNTHLAVGLERFKKMDTVDVNINQNILHTIDMKTLDTPEEAMKAYTKLIEGKVEK